VGGFVATGLGLIGLAVLLALRSANDMTSLAALLAGVLLLVVAGVGRLPEEVGLQRISFGHPPQAAREYREALYDAVQTALPELDPPIRGHDWQPDRPTGWTSCRSNSSSAGLRMICTGSTDRGSIQAHSLVRRSAPAGQGKLAS
jgi:hypothetical protein